MDGRPQDETGNVTEESLRLPLTGRFVCCILHVMMINVGDYLLFSM